MISNWIEFEMRWNGGYCFGLASWITNHEPRFTWVNKLSLSFRQQQARNPSDSPNGGSHCYTPDGCFLQFLLFFLFERFNTRKMKLSSQTTFRMRPQNIFRSKLDERTEENLGEWMVRKEIFITLEILLVGRVQDESTKSFNTHSNLHTYPWFFVIAQQVEGTSSPIHAVHLVLVAFLHQPVQNLYCIS